MKMFIRCSLAMLVLALATPIASHAANCPAGWTETDFPGGGFSCTPPAANAPEVSLTESGAGLLLLGGVALMIRGRKRLQPTT